MDKKDLRSLDNVKVGDKFKRNSNGLICELKQIIKGDSRLKEDTVYYFSGFAVDYKIMDKFFQKSASGFLLY